MNDSTDFKEDVLLRKYIFFHLLVKTSYNIQNVWIFLFGLNCETSQSSYQKDSGLYFS